MKWLTVAVLFILSQLSHQAAHDHSHKKHGERETDGAFSPRDHGHHGGGDHDSAFDHEAIIGSRKDAEEFDDLSPEEAKTRLAQLLKKMDRNQDQNIDRNELFAWIIRSFKSLSKEDSEDRFADADENEDGKVSWDEYKKEEYDLEDGELHVRDPDDLEELKLMEEDSFLFKAADKDNDGYLNSDEFLSFSHPEEDETMHPYVIDQVLKERDTDQDGKLSFQEFVGERGKDKDKEWLLSEKDRFDSDLDKNGDNFLNREEILAWIVPSNEDIANDEVTHLFAGADADVNGILTFKEIIDNHDLFVGSEATDFGDHLHNLGRFEDEL